MRAFSSNTTFQVLKGRITQSETGRAFVAIDGSTEAVWAKVHPRGIGSILEADATVFVSRPFASEITKDAYELIAIGTKGSEGKLSFTKYSCVHPDRPLSTPDKLCSNCPRRSNLK